MQTKRDAWTSFRKKLKHFKMTKKDEQLVSDLKRVVGNSHTVFSGKVLTVDDTSMTCSVQLTANHDPSVGAATPGVLLNVVAANMGGISLIPSVNADCLVCEVDGPGSWAMLAASSYTKVSVTIGSNHLVMDANSVTAAAGSNTLVMDSSGVKVTANVATIKAPTINIGAGDAFANHFAQYEGVLSVINWVAGRVTTIEQRWNAFKLGYAPGSGGSPAAIPAITVPRGPSLSVMKLEGVKSD